MKPATMHARMSERVPVAPLWYKQMMPRISALIALFISFTSVHAADVRFGIDVLEDENFKSIEKLRVGLVANPASVDAKLRHTADVLHAAKNVKLVALFGPEHGVYGNAAAGEKIEDQIDPRIKKPLYSLYGKNNRPTTQAIKKIDALLFDLQDIGSRSYTYIATMKNCMEACAEHDTTFIILDRPNPLGGVRVEGPDLQKGFESGVSSLPVPYVHGMTMGELAQLVQKQFFPKYTKLKVVKMNGWSREMIWRDTGHEWIPTSPHVPHADTCFAYAATGILGELYIINIGVGYTMPFEMVGSPWINGEALAGAMPKHKGIVFRPAYFKPYYSTFKGEACEGIQMHWPDPKSADDIVQINYELMSLLNAPQLFKDGDAKALAEAKVARKAALKKNYKKASTQPFKWDARSRMVDKVSGSDEPRKWLIEGKPMGELFAKWKKQCEQFREKRKQYLLY
jgi:uncharacterized protein YbbC (DUF1343 family)